MDRDLDRVVYLRSDLLEIDGFDGDGDGALPTKLLVDAGGA
jgi:hypothetical protein